MKFCDIASRMNPVQREAGLQIGDRWVWCGSAIHAEDDRYHLFAASWSKERPFFSGYIVSSEIIHAVSDTPTGPFEYVDTVLPDRGEKYWDGRMTHNPTIYFHDGLYYLFYIGATYSGKRPSGSDLEEGRKDLLDRAYSTIRIGVATAKSINGPFIRRDAPVLDIRAGEWDSTVVTNPTACFLPSGEIYLYYRSNTPQGLRIGVARASAGDLRFERLAGPILQDHPEWSIEDPYVWHNGTNFEMIAKDMHGNICGEKWGGAHFLSQDGIHWETAPVVQAYSRTLHWADGKAETVYHFERPCLLIEDGEPRCLYAAVGFAGKKNERDHSSFADMERSINIAIEIRGRD